MPVPVLYVLHFRQRLHHAGHYLGSTLQLRERLHQHATGDGARLTAVLCERGLPWELAAVYAPRDCTRTIRELEALAKRHKNSVDFCPLCNQNPLPPRGTIQIPHPPITSENA